MSRLKIRRAAASENAPWGLLLAADRQKHEVEKYLARGELWLAEVKNKTVGAMILMQTRSDIWEIMNIAVLAKWRRKGIGTALIKKARSLSKARGAHRLEVGTDNLGLQRIAFYQHAGFRIIDVDLDFFVRRYGRVIKHNGMEARDMLRLAIEFPR